MAAGHIPSFNEYYKSGLASSGMCVLNLIPLLLMGQILPDDILKEIFYPSKIHDLLELTVRIKDDITDFEVFNIQIKLYFNQDELAFVLTFSTMCEARKGTR